MSELNTFLKVLKKVGYPNPEFHSIAKMVDYNPNWFLLDLYEELGPIKTNEFVSKSLEKISDGNNGIKININGPNSDEFAFLKLYNIHLDLKDDSSVAYVDWNWGKTKILFRDEMGRESYKTMEEISDETDMSDWGDYDEFVESILEQCNTFAYNNCGFGIWFLDRI